MAKFKIEESKENSTYTVKVKNTWYSFWRDVKKKNGQIAVFKTKKAANLFMSNQLK
jgi:hypothetical protein